MTSTVSPQELKQKVDNGHRFELIDVRTPAEFQEVHVRGARNIPLDRLDPLALPSNGYDSQPLYVICKVGGRGQMACQKLLAAGMSSVANVEGGTDACVEAGLPVVRGKKAVSLERQVRIAAGSLVLAGGVLALAANPVFVWLPILIGGGLVFSGVTDTCGMAMALARMPWNQVPETCQSGCSAS